MVLELLANDSFHFPIVCDFNFHPEFRSEHGKQVSAMFSHLWKYFDWLYINCNLVKFIDNIFELMLLQNYNIIFTCEFNVKVGSWMLLYKTPDHVFPLEFKYCLLDSCYLFSKTKFQWQSLVGNIIARVNMEFLPVSAHFWFFFSLSIPTCKNRGKKLFIIRKTSVRKTAVQFLKDGK